MTQLNLLDNYYMPVTESNDEYPEGDWSLVKDTDI